MGKVSSYFQKKIKEQKDYIQYLENEFNNEKIDTTIYNRQMKEAQNDLDNLKSICKNGCYSLGYPPCF